MFSTRRSITPSMHAYVRHLMWQQPMKFLYNIHIGCMYNSLWNGISHIWRNVHTNYENNYPLIKIVYPKKSGVWNEATTGLNNFIARLYANQ